MTRKKTHPRLGGPLQKILNGVCMASARISEDKCSVGFMYREKPEEDLDTGWRFLSGDEDESYLNDESNYGIFDVEYIVKLDPLIKNYIHLPVGTELERKDNKFISYSEDA